MPTLSEPTYPACETGKTVLNTAQKGILNAKIKKYVDKKEILEENLKRAFTIIHGQCTESILAKLGGDNKYEAIKRYQDVIEMLNLIKGVMFKFDRNKKLTHEMWDIYVSVFRCRKHIFETNEELFEHFKNSMRFITQYDGLNRQGTGLLNHLGSKEDAQ